MILNTSRRCLYCSCEIEATLERLKKLERDLSTKEQELKERERRLKMWERKLIEQSNTPVSSSVAYTHCTPRHQHPQHNHNHHTLCLVTEHEQHPSLAPPSLCWSLSATFHHVSRSTYCPHCHKEKQRIHVASDPGSVWNEGERNEMQWNGGEI